MTHKEADINLPFKKLSDSQPDMCSINLFRGKLRSGMYFYRLGGFQRYEVFHMHNKYTNVMEEVPCAYIGREMEVYIYDYIQLPDR